MPKFHCTVLFDASSGATVEANTPEEAVELALEKTDGDQRLCHQCASSLETGDEIGVVVYDADYNEVLNTSFHAEQRAKDTALIRQMLEAIEAETSDTWECNSYHPKLYAAVIAAREFLRS